MASTAPRPLGETGTGGATFSYAQAAKGRQIPVATPAVQSSQATLGENTPPRDRHSVTEDFSGSVSGSASGSGRNELEKTDFVIGAADSRLGSNGILSETKVTSLAPASSFPSSPSVGTASTSTLPKEDELSFAPKLSADSPWEIPSQTETLADQSYESIDLKKGKRGKKDKASESETELERAEVKPEILVAAPLPVVNFWQQRIEAQAAKTKSNPSVAEIAQNSVNSSVMNGTLPSSTVKSADFRKKIRSVFDETERSQNFGVRDQVGSSKPRGKAFELNGRPKEDVSGKRISSRGSRLGDKEEKSSPMRNVPPPVEDAISWPTPDTALEEKRKVQEKSEKVEKDEKDELASNKPRAKEKWVTVPYIPTVTFNTPLPIRGRGGRGGGSSRGGGGGGRGGHAPNGSIGGIGGTGIEKGFTSAPGVTGTGNEPRERGRDSVSAGRAASLPPNSSNRSTSDNTYYPRDQRKPSVSTFDKPKHDFSGSTVRSENYVTRESRRTSIAIQTEPFPTHTDSRQSANDNGKSNRHDSSNIFQSDIQFQSRSAGSERRIESNFRMNDFHRENNGQSQARERGEGRGERGRGGYRGRGNHANFQNGQSNAQHAFTNGHGHQAQNSYGLRQSSGPYSPPLQQQQQQHTQYNTTYPTPSPASRAGRGGPARSQSIPTNAPIYARFSPPTTSSALQIAPLQTAGSVYDYPMSTIPFNYYLEHYSILGMVTTQLEYYFSIDNLCKDVFLRKHMDSKGYVFLTTIGNFKRIQSLTQDFELLRYSCRASDVIQIVTGEDGIDRLRRADGWEKWVLPMEDRDEIARNDGPERVFEAPKHIRHQPLPSQIASAPHSAISPAMFSSNALELTYPHYGPDQSIPFPIESPLSAAVPDFLPNPRYNSMSELEAETTFTDEEVDKLQLVYNHKAPGEFKQNLPSRNASSRTFSNGSIDGRSVTEDLMELHKHQSRAATNGDSSNPEGSPDKLRRSKSSFAMSPTKIVFGSAPPVMWVKGQRDQTPVTEANKNEPYNVVRARALRRRDLSVGGETDGDMKLLYQFWSHFLVQNFNPRMYEEFRNCALDDAKTYQNMFGITNLIQYYDEVLNSKKKIIPEVLARHYVELVNSEDRSADRPGFSKLRTAWRNGALDMKSRKRVDNFVDPKLRDELER